MNRAAGVAFGLGPRFREGMSGPGLMVRAVAPPQLEVMKFIGPEASSY